MNAMKKAGAALLLGALGGCGWSVGASTQERVEKHTLGRQLIDLKKARETGAISQADYATKRKELIDAALAATP